MRMAEIRRERDHVVRDASWVAWRGLEHPDREGVPERMYVRPWRSFFPRPDARRTEHAAEAVRRLAVADRRADVGDEHVIGDAGAAVPQVVGDRGDDRSMEGNESALPKFRHADQQPVRRDVADLQRQRLGDAERRVVAQMPREAFHATVDRLAVLYVCERTESGAGNLSASLSRRHTCSSVKRNGVGRRPISWAKTLRRGISCSMSSPRANLAKGITVCTRRSRCGAELPRAAHASTVETLMCLSPRESAKREKLSNSAPQLRSSKPAARRIARYDRRIFAIMASIPAMAARSCGAREHRPWRRGRSFRGANAEGGRRYSPSTSRPAASAWRPSGARDDSRATAFGCPPDVSPSRRFRSRRSA